MESTRNLAGLGATFSIFAMSISLMAHHGTSISYEPKAFEAKAVITEFQYKNPHPQLYFDITDPKGNVEHWSAEMGTDVNNLQRNGWSRKLTMETLKPGTVVTLTLFRSRQGGPYGLVRGIKNAKGEWVLNLNRSADATGPAE